MPDPLILTDESVPVDQAVDPTAEPGSHLLLSAAMVVPAAGPGDGDATGAASAMDRVAALMATVGLARPGRNALPPDPRRYDPEG